ncbi:MAG: GNAT family N-acetyltransferase [Desulfarculales bacterium]|nr:GNAT family N-acetyltransferase [Desulfarculales bacterium]
MAPEIYSVRVDDYDEIVSVWEESVRYSHHFLSPPDILFYKEAIRNDLLPRSDVICSRDHRGKITGFAAVRESKLEMLFIIPARMGTGLGKRLLKYAADKMGARCLDVNEDNQRAVNFYLGQGCRLLARSPRDGAGRPYPLLHLEIAASVQA